MCRWIKQVLLSSLLAMSTSGASWALDPIDTTAVVNEVTAEKIRDHLEQFQAIAARHDNNRALGTPGYRASVQYVTNKLINAGFAVQVQPFTANLFEELSAPVLVRTAPTRKVYKPQTDFATMTYATTGDVTAQVALARRIKIPPTPQPSSASGCLPSDFPAAVSGKIVLIQRGTCTFFEKARNARRAGAVAVIIFNEGQPGRTELLTGTLGNQVGIPVVGATFQVGRELYNLVRSGALVRLRVAVNSKTTPVETFNVIGEKRGRIGKVVLAGAHLDSVPEGPGINDNGSGSATLLTIVEAMAKLQTQPYNTVRFAFWGAEEAGLFGSSHYVSALSQAALDRIALNLNFDMLGSPNYVRFVYDGDGSIGDAGPPGSEVIEQVFVNYFKARGLPTEPTEFDGRSDYLAFIEAGIPAGGLFSGAEDKKTVRQARLYGGTAGVPYDRCYHKACDDLSNVSDRAIRELGKASAHAVLTFAMTKEDISAGGRPPSRPARVRMNIVVHTWSADPLRVQGPQSRPAMPVWTAPFGVHF